jgi:3-methylcrotonyl-CoA carboxylase alpha subunit
MFGKILIANRGEIAARIARTAKQLGIATVAIYSDADRQALHVAVADEAFRVGPPLATESYLNVDAIIAIAKRSGAEAIHPGYGFLSENAEFAESVAHAGLVFIGPPAAAIRAMGLKDQARKLMAEAGVPVLPGYNGESQRGENIAREATRIGYPVIVKPVAGGGGKGMHRVNDAASLSGTFATARREATSAFGDARLLLEKFLPTARHIEIQVFADNYGNTIHLFERDCSLQRRHQKVIEEAPAPGMAHAMRAGMGKAAVEAAKAVGYAGAGTVEFIADVSDGLRADRFYFMEMNTRLQVEHPVTEMITGLDLVEWQLRVAYGEVLPLKQEDISISGHAVEARLYAEDPVRNFLPQTGKLTHLNFSDEPGLRIDSGVQEGDTITTHYDPMIAKVIAHAPTRANALHKLSAALARCRIGGCRTNLVFLNRLARNPTFMSGNVDTSFIERNIDRLAKDREPPMEAIAAALLHVCGHLTKPASSLPFDTLRNFQLWPGEARTTTFDANGMPLDASLVFLGSAEFESQQAGRSLHFSVLDFDDEMLRLDIGGRIVQLMFFHDNNVLMISLENAVYEFVMKDFMGEDGEDDASGSLVIAAVPGLIRVVSVKAGDRVAKGDSIAMIEAMKMEFPLKAKRGGKIGMVHVEAGQQVAEGTIIATIEDDDA